MEAGLIGRKLGMTQLFTEDGGIVPVTAIEAGPCTVVQVKTEEKDGYQAVQVGFGHKKRLNKPEQGHLKDLGSFRALREFRVTDASAYKLGQKLDVGMFQAGALVDVTGRSRGMGFAGVVKRHHFAGGPKTHGQSDRHRAPGAIGSGTTPGRVWKNLRMAGHMGDARVTTQNLKIVQVDPARNLLLVRGAVPGVKDGVVIVRLARKGQPVKRAAAAKAKGK